MSQEIRNTIQELHDLKKSSSYIIAIVADDHKVSENEVRKIYKEMNLSQSVSQDLETLVRIMRDNIGKVTRDELVTMMSEQSGYSKSTSNHMLSQLNFAKEYSKQVNIED